MSAERHALSTVSPPKPPADADYEAICAAVTATARGRWFLDEYAKRNRNSDTAQVVAAIARLEATVVGERAQQANREAHQEVRIELLEMARTIAQARADAAEAGPAPAQQAAPAAGGAAPPDVAVAAERLRQIAWTMRACGVDLPACEQVGEIANAILSADALRGLGEQRAQKLTEALHYLEHRIDRMLDSHRAAPDNATEVASAAAGNSAHDAAPVTVAVAMIAAAMRPDPAAEAEIEAAPAPAAVEARAAAMAQDALAASDTAAFSTEGDDDVVLTIADSTTEPAPEPPPAAVAAPAPQDERVEPEIEPLTPAIPPTAEDATFDDREFEPLAAMPVDLAAPSSESPAAVADVVVDQPAIDEPTPPPAEPAAVAAESSAEPDDPDSGANDNLPLMLAATVTAKAVPEPDAIAMQVDQDLDGLTDSAPDDAKGQVAADSRATPKVQPIAVQAVPDDGPAEALLEQSPPQPSPHQARVSAAVAGAQAARAQLTDTLAAIESELFGSTRPDSPASTVIPPAATAKPAATPVSAGPLAALAAMHEEERIALFS